MTIPPDIVKLVVPNPSAVSFVVTLPPETVTEIPLSNKFVSPKTPLCVLNVTSPPEIAKVPLPVTTGIGVVRRVTVPPFTSTVPPAPI